MPAPTFDRQWRPTGRVAPTGLLDARLQVHHAVQLVVSASISYLPPSSDDSHTNLEWIPQLSAMAGRALPGASGWRVALRPADLALLVTAPDWIIAGEFLLAGQTVADADRWMRDVLGRSGFDPSRLTQKKHYEIPAHAVALGQPFQLATDESFAEVSAYYGDAWCLTTAICREQTGASEPRIWPHHADLATLITVATPNGSPRRTIGVGLSPGDDSYAQPYIYIGPYPHPPSDRLPPLSIGRWHTAGWIGAVLLGAEFTGETGANRALAFCRQGIEACQQAFSTA